MFAWVVGIRKGAGLCLVTVVATWLYQCHTVQTVYLKSVHFSILQNVQKGRMSTQKCELSCTLDVTVFELIAIVGALTQFLFHSQISTIPNLLQKFNVLGGFI